MLTSGNRNKALPVFERIYRSKEADYVKTGAYRGMIFASGDDGLTLAIKAIEGGPGPEQDAALQLVREVQAHGATTSFARLVPKVGTPVQLALVEGLWQRGDTTAASELASFATSAPPEVRTALIRTLGSLGDASMVPLLAGFAGSGTAVEQAAARQALIELRRGDVTTALLADLPGEVPSVQAELARALGNRGDRAAVPKLMELAQGSNKSVRGAALKALAELITAEHLAGVVDMVLLAKDPAVRQETAQALNAACRRLTVGHRDLVVGPLITGLKAGAPEARAALLPMCSELPLPEVRVALRQGLTDPDPAVKTAALHALCDTIDPELIDELVDTARISKDDSLRSLAIAGAVRLATQEEGVRVSREHQVAVLRA
ncbi:MAG TPA: HEAT repeat domain-containing protein, partial [Candidatus Dormibacteraeota bacterium]|nr:HEAT repeat domain-containing protein [Candidatus Dormibacteraeota bacterium]